MLPRQNWARQIVTMQIVTRQNVAEPWFRFPKLKFSIIFLFLDRSELENKNTFILFCKYFGDLTKSISKYNI